MSTFRMFSSIKRHYMHHDFMSHDMIPIRTKAIEIYETIRENMFYNDFPVAATFQANQQKKHNPEITLKMFQSSYGLLIYLYNIYMQRAVYTSFVLQFKSKKTERQREKTNHSQQINILINKLEFRYSHSRLKFLFCVLKKRQNEHYKIIIEYLFKCIVCNRFFQSLL